MRISGARLMPRRAKAVCRTHLFRRPALEALENRFTLAADSLPPAPELLPGDANQDLAFDQLDLVQVLRAGKYLTGEPATWQEGDWNGAPGKYLNGPPQGDGVFDQLDVLAALSANSYNNGRYAAIAPRGVVGDDRLSIVYDPNTGQIAVDTPAGRELTSINLDSDACIFTGEPAHIGGGSFEADSDCNIFMPMFGGSFGDWNFGNVARTGLSEEYVLNDLTVVGSLYGGGAFWRPNDVDLVYCVSGRNLAGADFSQQDLRGECFRNADLTGADFQGALLTDVSFDGARLTGAQFSDAIIVGASFDGTTRRGFTAEQLYSTASYQQGDLRGIGLANNRVDGWDFEEQDLTGASFSGAGLTGANFTGAVIKAVNFVDTTSRGFTQDHLASTASYLDGDLEGINLSGNDLSGWELAGQDLAGALFSETRLTRTDLEESDLSGASFPNATLREADLTGVVVTGSEFGEARGFTQEQLHATASYREGDLAGIRLDGHDLSGWDFAGKSLVDASFSQAVLTGANLSQANLVGASLRDANLSDADLSDANVTDADFSGSTLSRVRLNNADVRGADIPNATDHGFTAEQLYSTASYQQRNLNGIDLRYNDLSGWKYMSLDVPILNAGYEEGEDRALAIGATSATRQGTLEFLSNVLEADATSFQLQFDMEVWDAASETLSFDLPGEAAFHVTLDIDSGEGFTPLADLGHLTTGPHLVPPSGDLVDGNAGVNQVSFDSGIVNATIPAGSTLRIRWTADAAAETIGWVFGLDNVVLRLLNDDRLHPGDADRDLDFDQFDIVQVLQADTYLTEEPATWQEGDWNRDGVFDQLDIVAALQTGDYLQGPYAADVLFDHMGR